MRRRWMALLAAAALAGGAACDLQADSPLVEDNETVETPTDEGTTEEPTDEPTGEETDGGEDGSSGEDGGSSGPG